MEQKDLNEMEWSDKINWKWGIFYYSHNDTRVWAPKKPKWCGWTLNFAKKQSYLWLLFIALLPVVVVFVLNVIKT